MRGAYETFGCFDFDFSAFLVTAAVVATVAVLASWLLVELVLPALFFVVYVLFRRALVRVTRNGQGCRRRALASLGWGLVWSAVYTAPLALAVYAFHFALRHH